MYRRRLMYLNRTVALECPELQVPWFHEEYCQEILKKRKYFFKYRHILKILQFSYHFIFVVEVVSGWHGNGSMIVKLKVFSLVLRPRPPHAQLYNT